jgi:short-subunit dehydrogenase
VPGTTPGRKVTLITGASSGIGAEFARVFAAKGHDLALVARNRDRLAALADELAQPDRARALVLAIDLSGPSAGTEIVEALDAEGASVEILVNNAGFGLIGDASELPISEQLAVIDLNNRMLVETTLRLLPQIRESKGKILNVASIGAYCPGGPGMAVYYASKAFILSFSLSLWLELRSQGVGVTVLSPGVTPTGFQDRAGFTDATALARTKGPDARQVAEHAYAGLIAGKREVVPGLLNKVFVFALPYLPKSVILSLLYRAQQTRHESP